LYFLFFNVPLNHSSSRTHPPAQVSTDGYRSRPSGGRYSGHVNGKLARFLGRAAAVWGRRAGTSGLGRARRGPWKLLNLTASTASLNSHTQTLHLSTFTTRLHHNTTTINSLLTSQADVLNAATPFRCEAAVGYRESKVQCESTATRERYSRGRSSSKGRIGRLPRQVREPPKEWQNNRLPGLIFFMSLSSWICTNLGPLLRSAHNGY